MLMLPPSTPQMNWASGATNARPHGAMLEGPSTFAGAAGADKVRQGATAWRKLAGMKRLGRAQRTGEADTRAWRTTAAGFYSNPTASSHQYQRPMCGRAQLTHAPFTWPCLSISSFIFCSSSSARHSLPYRSLP